jgi:hypothetical protein
MQAGEFCQREFASGAAQEGVLMTDWAEHLIAAKQAMAAAEESLAQGKTGEGIERLRWAINSLIDAHDVLFHARDLVRKGGA